MVDRSHSATRNEDLEVRPNPTFRRNLEYDPAATGLLGTEHTESAGNNPYTDRSDGSSGTNETSNRTFSPTGQWYPGNNYKSVDTAEKPALDPGSRFFWSGSPAYSLTWELLGVIISILFLVLGAFVVGLKDKPESEWSKQVVQATKVAPSIWPILFSGILGNAVRQFANWKAERGIRLLALEQLMSSLTMAGTVIAMFTLSIFRFSSVALLVLWLFNPLGSQASFRGVYLVNTVGHGTGKISYYSHNLSTQEGLSVFQGDTNKPTIRSLYSAALYDATSNIQYVNNENTTFKTAVMKLGGPQSAGVQSAMDSWGNVRIPTLEHLDAYDAADPSKWIRPSWREHPQNYSSLVGDRFDGLDRSFTGNTTFNMTTSYQNFNCSPWQHLNAVEADRWAVVTFGQSVSALTEVNLTNSELEYPFNRDFRRFWGASSVPQEPFSNLSAPGHPQFIFASTSESDGYLVTTSCLTGTTYVDVQVSCTSRGASGKASCGVDAIRQSSEPTEPPEVSVLEGLRVDNSTLAELYNPLVPTNFLAGFTDLLDENYVLETSIILKYLHDPSTALDNVQFQPSTDLGIVDVKLFEKRLGLLYNTLWKVGWTFESMTGANMSAFYNKGVVDAEGIGEIVQVISLMNITSQTVRPLEPVYALDAAWLIVYFVSVGVMLLAAVASLILHANCKAPPLLGYVSSLTRDSIFFGEPGMQGNSIEDGPKRTRRLRKTEVKIADVWSEESVGRVAFAPAQGKGPVKKQRWYE